MVRAGFIGTGGISGVHLGFVKNRKDARVVALCDINKANLAKRQKEYGGEAFGDYEQMLDKVKLDAVWLCTPPQVRGDVLIACAKRGIPVFCEKPVERDAAKARRIAKRLAALKAHVQVGYCLRTMSPVQELRKAMADDKIHVAQSFYMCDMSLARTMPNWFFDKKISGGALIDQATHNFDLLRYLLGEVASVQGMAHNPVAKKKAGYTIDEAISLTMLFKNGTLVSHSHTWVGDGWRNELVLSGEKRTYRLDVFAQKLVVQDKSGTREFVEKEHGLHYFQNELFLKQVQTSNWRTNPCEFADAVKTLELTLAADKALG